MSYDLPFTWSRMLLPRRSLRTFPHLATYAALPLVALLITDPATAIAHDRGSRRVVTSLTQSTSVKTVRQRAELVTTDSYSIRGDVVPLHRSDTRIVVRLKGPPDLTAAERGLEHALRASPRHRSTVLDFRERRAQNLVVMTASNALQDEDLTRLRSAPEVDYVGHVFINTLSGTELISTDRIVLELRPGQAPSTIDDLNRRHGTETQERIFGTDDQFVVRVPNAGPRAALDIANALNADPAVEWAQPDFLQDFQRQFIPNDPLFPSQWHLNNTGQGGGTNDADVDAPLAWDATRGEASTVIAILDDGVERTHEDIAPNLFVNPGEIPGNFLDDDHNGFVDDVNGWDFTDFDNNPNPDGSGGCNDLFLPADCHGQAVVGVAAAAGSNGIGVSGACPNCRILPVKIFDEFGVASESRVATAIRYAGTLADILNNSWAGAPSLRSAPIESAIADVAASGRDGLGAPVLFASGNAASGYIRFELQGFPGGQVTVEFRYSKNSTVTQGDDTVWLDDIIFPGSAVHDFENGSLPAGCTSTGSAFWSVVNDPVRALSGSRALRAGTIGHGGSVTLTCTRGVSAGDLVFAGWVSSESTFDSFEVFVTIGGVHQGPFFDVSGVPDVFLGQVAFPANQPGAWAIGASTNFDLRSFYSQFGPQLLLVAPSDGGSLGISTTDRTGTVGYASGNYLSDFSGTSAATPLASGVVGLVLSAFPGLTRDEVALAVQRSADEIGPVPYPGGGRNDQYGYGRINAAAAIQQAAALHCGDATVDAGEQCDDGNRLDGDCCSALCKLEPATTRCRAAAGVCDLPEFCTGGSPACPADLKSTSICRSASGTCDVPDSCNGSLDFCPDNVVLPAGTLCRGAAGICDVEERCDGTGPSCPANAFVPNGTSCDDGMFCSGTDACNGGVCLHGGDPCAGGSECARTCNEGADDCFAVAGTACSTDFNPCTDDRCDGSGICRHGANSVACDDHDVCTIGDVCAGGACAGTPVTCGDGTLQMSCNEQCDDGNAVGGDTCPADCRLGLPSATPAKRAGACQKAIAKAGLGFVSKKLKSVSKCALGVLKCVQTISDGDPKQQACIRKAGEKCVDTFAKIAAIEGRLEAQLLAACGEQVLSNADLRNEHGLGYEHLAAECLSLDTAAAVAACVADQHACRTTQVVQLQQPRLHELMSLAQVDGSQIPCLVDLGGGGDVGDPDGVGKAMLKCMTAAGKAATGVVTKRLKALGNCVNAIVTCAQARPTNASCLPKAQRKCIDGLGNLAELRAKLDAAVDKRCQSIDFASISSQPNGAHLGAPAAECSQYGVLTLDDYGDFKSCLFNQHICRAEELMGFEAPRAQQLFGLVGLTLRSAFCPVPPGAPTP